MSDIVIHIENLGKSYIIGHETRERYTALRDIISNKTKQIVSKSKYMLNGGQLIAGVDLEEFWALKEINIDIKQGASVGIIGRNGAGKSTLLKILSRITEPTTGRVMITGRVASLLEVGTGFHPELSGRENIYLNGAILGMTRKEIKQKFDEIVDFSGIEKFLDTPVKRYSSGMYVRLAFAVAAHLESDIMIVDEVLAVGDVEFQKKCLSKMGEVSKGEGRTVLFVSHNLSAIKQLCSTSILLNNGEMTFAGTSKETIDRYLLMNINTGLTNVFIKDHLDEKEVQIVKAEITDKDDNKRQQFDISEDIFIYLSILCKKAIPNTYGYMAIRNSQQELIIESDTYDYLPNCLDSLNIGLNCFKCKINKNVLAFGEYTFSISLASEFGNNFLLDTPGQILKFTIQDNETSRGINRKALTSYLLKLELQHVI